MEEGRHDSRHDESGGSGVAERHAVPVGLGQVQLGEGFWSERVRLVRDKIIPYQWEVLNDRVPGAERSHAIENFRIAAGDARGEFYGRPFQDSDVAKWLEAVGYLLTGNRDPELEAMADGVIDLIARAQQPDGYLDTYFILGRLDKRWTNVRDLHELYCAGHMIEAAVAYYRATGKRRILDVACRLADHIDSVFGPDPGKKRGYPGHEEIELALVKLYRVTGEERYLRLSKYFVDERGRKPYFFDEEARARGEKEPSGPYKGEFTYEYNQAHIPVREQSAGVGHAVRAMYLYSAMADLAAETGDGSLAEGCRTLWNNVTEKQMYVTGSIGSTEFGEAFSFDYDLPNDTAYNETCAAIGLVFWAHRMLHLDPDSRYADVMERALYNGVLSGVSLDGTGYFYVNPLEVWPEACGRRRDKSHVAPARQEWFGCACCPPNLARLLASFPQYIYSTTQDEVYVHIYASSLARVDVCGQPCAITQSTAYPWQGTAEITISPDRPLQFTLSLRVPGWCRAYEVRVNGSVIDARALVKQGYVHIRRTWQRGDKVELTLAMPVERVRANPAVRADAGKVAIQRGPLVYCLEEVDNGPILTNISLPREAALEARFEPDLLGGVVVVTGQAQRTDYPSSEQSLYTTREYRPRPVLIAAVPYFAWNNREPGEMLVWIRET